MGKQDILKVLKDGPAHCHDVADETGMTAHLASRFLSQMFRRGDIKRNDVKIKHCEFMYKCWLYYL